MIFWKQSYIGGFWNLVGDSPTWPNFYTHKKFDAHQKVHGLDIYIHLTYTYPILSWFEATFCLIIISHHQSSRSTRAAEGSRSSCEAAFSEPGCLLTWLFTCLICFACLIPVYFVCLFVCLLLWLIDWLAVWLIDWLFDWLTDWLTDCLTDWLIDLLIDWLIDWLLDRLTDWLTACASLLWFASVTTLFSRDSRLIRFLAALFCLLL